MTFSPTFCLHLADPLGFVDAPFIITTAYVAKSKLCSEWFLVLPEGKGQLFAQRNRLDLKNLPANRLELDADHLLEEALNQAVLHLRQQVLERSTEQAAALLRVPTSTQTIESDYLSRLWMRGAYCGSLSEIRAKSECQPLIDTLIWIHGLPMLASSAI